MKKDTINLPQSQVTTFWQPTTNLRFVNGAEKILQQCWISNLGTSEWRNIPTVDLLKFDKL